MATQLHIQPHSQPDGQKVIIVWLSPDSIATGPDGNPVPGVAISSSQARSAAELLVKYAQEIEAA